jgi:hypothetical protein
MQYLLLVVALTFATPVAAYIGPGAGISVMGSLLNTLIVVVLAFLAILLWPLRLLWRKLRARKPEQSSGKPATPES